jgi:hypothetical protein
MSQGFAHQQCAFPHHFNLLIGFVDHHYANIRKK